jgi:predicted membrane channel-forming protein YqfA (hemolysin III family)
MIPIFLKLNHINSSLMEKLSKIDWAGSFIFIASTTSLLIGISWGGVMYPWDSWRTLVPIIIGFAGLFGFVFYEKHVAADPVIRLRVFKSRTSLVNYAGTFFHGLVVSLNHSKD